EQLVLFEVESTHRLGLASAEEDGRHFARATRALAFFNGLLERQPFRSALPFRALERSRKGGTTRRFPPRGVA
ncbi:hypothetical protein KGZ04_15670, partial [Pseudomonas aeruginosa]|uniref:hypothetical protein n=1 Tax=Pseudomonas aeruginosa TaxID=287 RepID=UPI0023425449